VGDFHIDTIVVERKNRKVSEPAKKKIPGKFFFDPAGIVGIMGNIPFSSAPPWE